MPALVVDWEKVGDGWTKLIDYVYTGVLHWLIEVEGVESDREMEVGMGLFIAGDPLGERKRFRGRANFWTIGGGRIVARTREGSGSVRVRLWRDFEEIRPDLEITQPRPSGGASPMPLVTTFDFGEKDVVEALQALNSAAERLAVAMKCIPGL